MPNCGPSIGLSATELLTQSKCSASNKTSAKLKLTSDGTVKVLDFGLAKALQEGQAPDLSNSPTLVSAASMPRVILGTAPYKGLMADSQTAALS